jgi:hypothetical protein
MTPRQCLLLVAAVCALAFPATASALPGDAPFSPLSPPDGAALPVDPDGIPVTYTCPVYRIADNGFTLYGGPKDYGISLSSSPAIGADGRLADAIRNTGSADPSGPDRCSARLGAGGPPPRIHETPGKYYWQVSRICTGCPGEYEVGPVLRVVLRSPVQAVIGAAKKAYAGYPFIATVKVAGAPDGTAVAVERQAGSAWRSAGSGTALGGAAEAVVTLPRGSQTLRATLTIGDQQIASASQRVSVSRARRWSTGARDDGRYRGKVGSRSVSFTVSKRGHELRKFKAFVPMVCPGVSAGQFTTQIGTAILNRVKIAPDGRFVAAAHPESDTAILLRGRLHHRKITGGRVQLSVGPCSGNSAYGASRAGR